MSDINYHTRGFFLDPVFALLDQIIGETDDIKRSLEPFGFECESVDLDDVLEDAGIDWGCLDSKELADAVASVKIPTTKPDGFRLKAVFETDRDIVALYLKPVRGLALLISDWISVDDRLPESDEKVMIWLVSRDMNSEFHVENGSAYSGCYMYGEWGADMVVLWDYNRVTHWQPEPAPPAGES